MTVVFTRAARRDILDIANFIAADSPAAANRMIDQLMNVIQPLDAGELNGREVRLISGQRVRSWPVPPYRIYYRRGPTRTLIYRVYHQARRPIE